MTASLQEHMELTPGQSWRLFQIHRDASVIFNQASGLLAVCAVATCQLLQRKWDHSYDDMQIMARRAAALQSIQSTRRRSNSAQHAAWACLEVRYACSESILCIMSIPIVRVLGCRSVKRSAN